eukprot:3055203-Rhodomonas_salina.7
MSVPDTAARVYHPTPYQHRQIAPCAVRRPCRCSILPGSSMRYVSTGHRVAAYAMSVPRHCVGPYWTASSTYALPVPDSA